MANPTAPTIASLMREFHLDRPTAVSPEAWLARTLAVVAECPDQCVAELERLAAADEAAERADMVRQLQESKRRMGVVAEMRIWEQSFCDAEIGKIDAAIAFLEVQR